MSNMLITQKVSSEKLIILKSWKNPFEELSISEIMQAIGKKSKPWVFNALELFTEKNLLVKSRKGNINLYSLNLNTPLLTQTLQFIDIRELYNFSHLDIIQKTINKIPINTYCLLIFGSYASGKQNKQSDLDACFLIENKEIEGKIKPYFNDIKLITHISIDEHYITFADFIKMLLREEENLAKQIFRNNKIFFNPDIYYQLIKEAYKNGFRA